MVHSNVPSMWGYDNTTGKMVHYCTAVISLFNWELLQHEAH